MKSFTSPCFYLLFLILCLCGCSSSGQSNAVIQPAFELLERQIGERASEIKLEVIAPENGKETFEIEARQGVLNLRGRSTGGRCYGVHN